MQITQFRWFFLNDLNRWNADHDGSAQVSEPDTYLKVNIGEGMLSENGICLCI